QLQLYFYANARIRALRAADGGTAFPVGEMVQPFGQPDVSTVDQTVHANVLAYTPNGDLLWKLFNIFNSSISFPACDVANNGIHYVVYPGQRLYAVNLDGSIRYQVDFAEPFGNPVASPDNGTLVIGSDISGSSNSIVGFNASNGVETWRETLPPENGAFQFVTTRARFTPDSSTAYVHTATAGNSAAAFLYAVDARPNSGNLPPHAVAAADRTAGHAPITIQFDGTGSSDPDGSIASYLWDFADGTTSTESQPRHNFSTAGTYRVKLTVTDNAGATAETYLQVEFTPGGCVSNCARVSAIRLMTWRRPAGRRVVGTVVVANENGQPLAGVTVKMVWAVPNRPTVPVTLTTDANGIATTTVSGAKGTYTLFTALIDAAGYTFDEGNSVSSRSITR
ncbi:MAG TPA: PKD domain-containing protein, partial [Pyrinomonadaceae bacterium]|nr:PKD domain-containing protein [Pyrinomonadaceae bacterium]